MTEKQSGFLKVIKENQGITTAELHRRIGKLYAHGHHKFTYETIARMHLRGMVRYGVAMCGSRGNGLYAL
jgi:hypothetical protein